MQIQNGKHRLFDDPDPILWKESEEAEDQNKQFISSWGKTRAKYLFHQAKNLKSNKPEYYKVVAELVDLCQNGSLGLGHSLSDKEWVSEALVYLTDLYSLLIKKVSYQTLRRYSLVVPHFKLEDFESLTKTLFVRLVVGDTPWAIDHFKDQEKHSPETYQYLDEIHIHKRWHDRKKYVEDTVRRLESILADQDMRVAKLILNDMLITFAEAENQPLLDFKSWVRWNLHHEQERTKRAKDSKSTLMVLANDKLTPILQVIQNDELLNGFIRQYQDYLEDAYIFYRKSAYKDRKFPKKGKYHFTAFIFYHLNLLINDFFKRKEFNIDRHITRMVDTENLPDTKSSNIQNVMEPWLQTEKGQRFFRKLTEREQQVASLCLIEGMKQVRAAKQLNISKGRVSQVIKKIKVIIKPFLIES